MSEPKVRMTIQEAIAVLFDCGLELLEDNARDLAKQDHAYAGQISEHQQVVRCKGAIAALREARDAGAVLPVEKA